jgi:hypothetical protein
MILQYVKTDYKNVGNYLTYTIEMPGPTNAMQKLIQRAKIEGAAAKAAAAAKTPTTETKVKPVKSDPVKPK